MTTRPQTAAIGLFRDPAQAQRAVRALKQAGFRDDEIGVLSPDTRKGGEGRDGVGEHVVEGATVGVAAGAGAGALWALGIAAHLLPGIGPVVAGGILVSLLSSAAGTAAVGGLVGALIGLGVPEDEARYYESEVTAGRTIVSVQAVGRAAEALAILREHSDYNRTPAEAAS